jgi:hypothetical protein
MVNVAEQYAQDQHLHLLIDPQLLRSARGIYQTFRVMHPRQDRSPHGVAIHRDTLRGQLIFRDQPILLPGEYFVPTYQLESDLH